MTAATDGKMLKWMVGLLVCILCAFVGFVIASIPWAMGVNRQLGGINEALRNQKRIEKRIDDSRDEISKLRKAVYERQP